MASVADAQLHVGFDFVDFEGSLVALSSLQKTCWGSLPGSLSCDTVQPLKLFSDD